MEEQARSASPAPGGERNGLIETEPLTRVPKRRQVVVWGLLDLPALNDACDGAGLTDRL